MINVFDLKPGQWIELADGRQAEVSENMDDGMWVSILDDEETELIHAQDIKNLIEER